MIEGRLTEFCVSFYSCNVTSALNGLPKYGELRFFVCSDKATKDGAPERVRILKQIFQAWVLIRLTLH